jgi:hypothetical protein
METVVRCFECNSQMEEHKVEKEYTNDAAIFVTPTCDCYAQEECQECN